MPFWGPDGAPCLDYRLLEELLSFSASSGETVQSGGLAKALDMWVADELRRAGFSEDSVWPRLHAPRVLDPAVSSFVQWLPANVAEPCCKKLSVYPSSEARVLGSTYGKQVDVGMSTWMTGPEIIISTKTMNGAFGKNLGNRFEEAYGDAKNLRGRHPLAALGFFFLVDSSIVDEPGNLEKAIAMMRRLRSSDDAYDAFALLLMEKHGGEGTRVLANSEDVPAVLSARHFFGVIVRLTLDRGPLDGHVAARRICPERL